MNLKIKIKVFLLERRNLLNFVIPFVFYLLYLSFIELNVVLITTCSGEPDPCMEALIESLKDLEFQNESRSWLSRTKNDILFEGKNAQVGTGSVERGGKVYVAQTVEVKNEDGSILRRFSDCTSGNKKK